MSEALQLHPIESIQLPTDHDIVKVTTLTQLIKF
jgi:hypothetical protein